MHRRLCCVGVSQCHSNENPLIISNRKSSTHPTCEFLNETPTQKKIIAALPLFFKSVVMHRCVARGGLKVIRIVFQTLHCLCYSARTCSSTLYRMYSRITLRISLHNFSELWSIAQYAIPNLARHPALLFLNFLHTKTAFPSPHASSMSVLTAMSSL